MKLLATVILLILFAGCATSSEPEISGAVGDYIKVAELDIGWNFLMKQSNFLKAYKGNLMFN